MMPIRWETDLLRRLAETPFADRLDLAALSGWSRGAVYAGMYRLQERGMVDAIPHATSLLPSTKRYYLTAHGLHVLAQLEGVALDELLRSRPVSAQWQRVLLERLDAVAVIYRLAAAVSNAAFPISVRLFRAAPADAGFVLPGGRTVAVVRQGNTADRTGFSKRLWRLREGPMSGGVLVLSPDEVRLRQARRMLAGARFPVYLALEKDAALAGPDSPVWHPPSIAAGLDLRYVLSHLDRSGGLPVEAQPARVALPGDIDLDAPAPDYPLPVLLAPAEKRVLDLLSDWLWASKRDLAGLMGVSTRRASQLTERLEEFGLLSNANAQGTRRLALSDRALALLARRDRTSVGTARRRWSVTPLDPEAPLTWRNVTGSRGRQLLRRGALVLGYVANPSQRPGLGSRAARPAPSCLPLLPTRGHITLSKARRLRRPAPGRRDRSPLPGVGEAGGAPGHHGGAASPLPALLRDAAPPGRPRRYSHRPGGLRRRVGRQPLPAGGTAGDGAGRGEDAPAGVPQGGPVAAGTVGRGLVHFLWMGTGLSLPRLTN